MSDLANTARQIRQHIIEMITAAGSGHPGGSLGLADIFAVIYFADVFNLNPQKPHDSHRDRIILSNGHVCPVWYAALALKGYFPIEELTSLRQFGSRLQGHPHKDFLQKDTNLPGIENTAGPLGQGISFAAGLALGFQHQQQQQSVVCITGDGELNEGQSWEGFMFASKYKLNNLTFIIDRNDIQIDGFTRDVMPLEPLKDKLLSFGLEAICIDGHNFESITKALKQKTSKPKAILARTIPGKSVAFMENKFEWHGKAPNADQAKEALCSIHS
jgi:transketolase